jgi:hypothetical protein
MEKQATKATVLTQKANLSVLFDKFILLIESAAYLNGQIQAKTAALYSK